MPFLKLQEGWNHDNAQPKTPANPHTSGPQRLIVMSGKRKIESRWYAEIVCNLLCLAGMLAGGWLWLQFGGDDPIEKLADIFLLYILVMLGAAEFVALIMTYILLIVFEKKAEKETNQGKWWVKFLFYERIEADT